MHHWVVLIRTEYEFCRAELNKDSFHHVLCPIEVFQISILIRFIWKVGWESSCLEVSSWYDWYSFSWFILDVSAMANYRTIIKIHLKLIWLIWSIPTFITISWIISIHFKIFDQNKILIVFESSESVICSLSRSQSDNPWIILLPLAPFPNLWIS